ncbi:hypothetical protein ACFQ71_39395 [Streptomyces sp. NPDC056534]|uniref:hypothetical protein n=1 Tax=Streptomyces sp. NPDC056534 TaxID=3345857 RepID=UPI00367F77B8
MYNDLGVPELVARMTTAMLVFGPDKLPRTIQDVSRFIRNIRKFSEIAKQDIRTELGTGFQKLRVGGLQSEGLPAQAPG